MKEEADLEIGRRECGKELSLSIGIKRFSGFVLDDHSVVDQHVHSLVRERFAPKVDQHPDFSFDFVPFRD